MKGRFVVKGDLCFVKLITDGKDSVGLCLQGETQLEEFCKSAIDAYEQLLRNKNKGRGGLCKTLTDSS